MILGTRAALVASKEASINDQSPAGAPVLHPRGKYPAHSLRLQVRQITHQAIDINSYELVHPEGEELPEFSAGAHIDFYFRDGSVRQYSLCNDPAERHRYLIAILRDAHGRGGSQALHERLKMQHTVAIGRPRNNFPLREETEHHLLLAGGIGVTPMMAMLARLQTIGTDFTLHYCTKAPEFTAFRSELEELVAAGRVILHHDGGDPGKGLDIAGLLEEHRSGTHLYYCGPAGFMRAAAQAAAHWPEGTVHCEYFTAEASPKAAMTGEEISQLADDTIGIGFQVKIASTGATFFVPHDQSIVQVLTENGIEVEVSCESGLCGTCATRYLEGEVDHRDLVLEKSEQTQYLTLCCSRAKSKILVLDL